MYGQTSGAAGEALRGLERAYPVAMAYLRAADEEGRAGRDVRTYGGRLVRMWPPPEPAEPAAHRPLAVGSPATPWCRARPPSCSRCGRSRCAAGLAGTGAEIVLCLHDELLVHVPGGRRGRGERVAPGCTRRGAPPRWAAGSGVRFVADVAVVRRWSDAKDVAGDAGALTGLAGEPVVRNA